MNVWAETGFPALPCFIREEAEQVAGYSHITWACPYFKWDGKGLVKCEAGRIVFPDRAAEKAHTQAHCASVEGWHRCSLAVFLGDYYDRQEERDREKRGQDQKP